MSVAVRMEMPRVCITDNGFYGYCPMDRVWCIQRNAPPDITMREVYEAMTDKIPSWCPILCQLPEGHGRLVDADAYSAEMKDRQEAAWKWRNEAIAEEDEVKLARAEGAFTAFTEAKLTMDKHIISQRNRVEEPPKEVQDDHPTNAH